MIRQIICIDEEKCNGCGLCVKACHEGAIDLVNGKAKLVRENFCDGFGDCLPGCPMGAITFENREAPEYDEKAVLKAKAKKETISINVGTLLNKRSSELNNWPVQIKLAPIKSDYFDDCDLLIAADCTAYAYGSLHNDFIKGRTVLIGCSKLDGVDYSNKLYDIFLNNSIRSITIVKMQVPCCQGLSNAVNNALVKTGKEIPLKVVTITSDGRII